MNSGVNSPPRQFQPWNSVKIWPKLSMIVVYVCCGDAGPGVHFVSLGLLQLTVWRHRVVSFLTCLLTFSPIARGFAAVDLGFWSQVISISSSRWNFFLWKSLPSLYKCRSVVTLVSLLCTFCVNVNSVTIDRKPQYEEPGSQLDVLMRDAGHRNGESILLNSPA